MKVRGQISFVDVESGVWVLKTDDGRTFQLDGGDRKLKQEGMRIEAEGEMHDVTTAAMVGPVFIVKTYQFI